MARIINSNEFKNEVLNSSDIVLVDFFAEWCGPCKMIAPALEELSSELQGKAKILKLDIDKSGDIAEQFKVMAVPTLIIFKKGKAVDKIVGFQPKNVLKDKLENYID